MQLISPKSKAAGRHKTVLKKTGARFAWGVVRAVIVLGLCYVVLYPYFIKGVNAFKSYSDFIDPTVRFIPKHPTLDNLRLVMERIDYWNTVWRTAALSTLVALITVLVSSLIAYGLARFSFKGKNLLFFAVILTMIIPPQTVIIPLYLRFQNFAGFLYLLDTPFPIVILVSTGLGLKNGLFIFMLRQYFRNLPKELEEAACLDGCGVLGTYLRIVLPSSRVMLITVFLLAFSWQWTDMVYNPLFLREIPIFSNIFVLAGAGGVEPVVSANMTSTAALLSVLPLAVLYVAAQNFFVQSVERSGIVG